MKKFIVVLTLMVGNFIFLMGPLSLDTKALCTCIIICCIALIRTLGEGEEE